MTFGNDISIRVAIFVLGLCGFMVARHINNHKAKNKPLICPARFDCNTVVHSNYSTFMSMPVEIAGMIYYAFITLAYFFLIFMPDSVTPFFIGFLACISLVAFLFSTYLLAVQIFILKKGCSWCLASTFISAVIFLLTIFSHDFSFVAQIFVR